MSVPPWRRFNPNAQVLMFINSWQIILIYHILMNLLDVISYTIDLTSYLSLHCYGYVVWWQTCDLQSVLGLTLTLTTYNIFFFCAIPSSSPRPNCFCESYKELQLYFSSSSVIFLVVISLWEMDLSMYVLLDHQKLRDIYSSKINEKCAAFLS